jgi:hypothetical protein
MMRKTTMALLLITACWIVPASAGGMHTDRPAAMNGNEMSAAERIREARDVHDSMVTAHLRGTMLAQFEGEIVMGSDGRTLGRVLRVDEDGGLLQILMPDQGMSVAMPNDLVSWRGGTLVASTVSREDAVAMVGTQNRPTMFAALD